LSVAVWHPAKIKADAIAFTSWSIPSRSIRTVGNFVKWLIVGILGLALSTVMFGESVAKILAWFGG
jgi:hypothetical protein